MGNSNSLTKCKTKRKNDTKVMGNSPTKSKIKGKHNIKTDLNPKPNPLKKSNNKNTNTNSTSALFESIFKIVSPIARRIISKILLNDYVILRDEKAVGKYKYDQPDNTLPIQPIKFSFDDIVVVDPECIRREKKKYPDFEWPENILEDTLEDMIVLDVVDCDCQINLAQGIEMAIPIPPLPMGVTGNLEIGANGKSIKEASIRIKIPKLRIWYIHGDVQKLYMAFWGRPSLIPHFGINADFGNGDIFGTEFTEAGCLDDVVEKVLSGFAPKELFEQKSASSSGSNVKQSRAGNRIGKTIIQIMSKFMKIGYGRPIVLDLHGTIQPSIDLLLGKPNVTDEIKCRTAEDIKADMKVLEIELNQVEPQKDQSSDANGIRFLDDLCCKS